MNPQSAHPGQHGPHSSSGGTAGWLDWAYKGVDHNFPGNGGPECRDFLGVSQRCWESLGACVVGVIALLYAYPRLRLPQPCPSSYAAGEPVGRRVLLLLMCLTFGIELGFKFSTRQMIWIGNPCHLATMMQIFILAAPPSRIVTAAFRLHMHMLTGAPIAILFPVINTRLLPFETGVYFVQHILMLIIPFYLMKIGDPFIPEPLLDFKWAFTSFGFLYIYHFLPLQYLAYLSQVNLNNMLCPAVSDPFRGKYYRLFAICHQIILIPTLGKVFVVLARAFNLLPPNDLPDIPARQAVSQCPAPCPPPPCCPDDSVYPCCQRSVSCKCDSGISGLVNREPSHCSTACTGERNASWCTMCNPNSSSAGSFLSSRGRESPNIASCGKTDSFLQSSRLYPDKAAGFDGPPSGGQSGGDWDRGGENYVTRRMLNGVVMGSPCCPLPQRTAEGVDWDCNESAAVPESSSTSGPGNGHTKAH